MKYSLYLFSFFMILFGGCQPKQPVSDEELTGYLREHWMSPGDYVMSKFRDHDYIFIGEYHRIRHDVLLIQHLIPRMYAAGITTLGIEFGDRRDQPLVDSLLALPEYDESLARKIMFHSDPLWGYKEYIDLYRVAWEVNHCDTFDHSRPFRVVNLTAHYDPCKKGGAWKDLDPDVYMAETVFQEIVAKTPKALIYSGNHHAFTRYHQPAWDFKHDSLIYFSTKRMGNIVYDSLGNRVFNIYLHAAWTSARGWNKKSVLPVNGTIDRVMQQFDDKRVGFDVVGTPFGRLISTDSYYALGYPDFTLDKYCDGYIYQCAFRDYQPITMEKGFITPENIGILKKHLRCIGVEEDFINSITVENANEELFEDIRNHFRHLM